MARECPGLHAVPYVMCDGCGTISADVDGWRTAAGDLRSGRWEPIPPLPPIPIPK